MTTLDFARVALAILLAAALIIPGTWLLRRGLTVFAPGRARLTTVRRWLPAIQVGVAIVLGTIVSLSILGPMPAAIFLGASLLVALASAWLFIRDAVAGVVLRAENVLEPGQSIRCGELTGTIAKIGARSLAIETEDGRRVRVPYGRLGASPLDLASARERGIALRFHVSVPRDRSVETDVSAIRRAAMHSFFASACFEPRVRLVADDPDARTFEVTVFAADPSHLGPIQNAVLTSLGRGRVSSTLGLSAAGTLRLHSDTSR